MTQAAHNRGGAPVGYLTELDAVEAGSVLYLRLWSDGPEQQQRVWQDFSRTLGPRQARIALDALSELCSLCARHGRRPIMRHDVMCKCLGADEACFANFVAAAARGDREDAMLIATLLVRPDMAPPLAALAQSLGMALQRMALVQVAPSGATGENLRPSGSHLH